MDLAAASAQFLVSFAAILLDHVDDVAQLLLSELFQPLVESVFLGLRDLVNFC